MDSFAYDQANRLTSATVNGMISTDTYDGDGKRASQTVGGTTTSYVYDVNTPLPNVLPDGTLKHVYGIGLAYAADSSGNVKVYHTDGLGSVRAITNGSGQVIQTYQTDPFSVPTQTQGTSNQPFQFTGQHRDGNGLVYLRARMYDPTIGRFLSRDPISGFLGSPLSLNRYAYALPNPTGNVDPSGLATSRILKDSKLADNECFTTLNGTLDYYVVNAQCLQARHQENKNLLVVITRKPGGVGLITPSGVLAAYAPDDRVADIMTGKKGSIKNAPLEKGSPGWDEILRLTWKDIEKGAKEGKPGFRTLRKILTDRRFNR